MPVAAVPAYLAQDFGQSSPGLRFGLFLPVWKDHDFSLDKKTNPLLQACKLTANDMATLHALHARQQHMALEVPHLFSLEATTMAPFTTGLGNEHPLENGFAFLNPYGLPYLPGSSIKGVLRQAARELASGDWDGADGWVTQHTHTLEIKHQPGIELSLLDVLFGLETMDAETQHVRGALNFWDVIPQIPAGSLSVDIMTPHQGHYYQQSGKLGGFTSPHDSGQPIPIPFLTVPAGAHFHFHVQCNLIHLRAMAPELAADAHWQTLLTAAFEHAFDWLGFGAKTAVGYGALASLAQQEQREIEAAQRRQQNAEMWSGARIQFNRANGSLSVQKAGQTAAALAPMGEALLQTLPAALQQRIRSNQYVKITAYVTERVLIRVVSE